MYAFTYRRSFSAAEFVLWAARLTGVALFVSWVGMLVAESIYADFRIPPPASFLQAAALALVFFGYAVGWKEKIMGGLFVLLGMAAFILINLLTVDVAPGFQTTWFALPGVLYLLAAYFSGRASRADSYHHSYHH
jgi:hypothetical protein